MAATGYKKDGCSKGFAGWAECTSCGGRIHKDDCSSKMDPQKDCCIRRHEAMKLPTPYREFMKN
jgi:hypothetical protein